MTGAAARRLSMTVDRVLALRQPPRERKPKSDKPRESWAAPDRLRDDRPRVDDDLNDHSSVLSAGQLRSFFIHAAL